MDLFNELSWMDDVTSEPLWYCEVYDITLLNNLKFRVPMNNNHIYSFSADMVDEVIKLHVHNYWGLKEPRILIYDENKDISRDNGCLWSWDEIRYNFIDGIWCLV